MNSILIKQNGKFFNLKIPQSFKLVYVHKKGISLFANKNFKEGEKIIFLKGKPVKSDKSTPEAVQINEIAFIDTKFLVPEDFINHSCNPNSKLDLNKRYFIAVRNIKKGEEITYNYLTTEWEMKKYGTDFYCACGDQDCYGHIRGFKYLTHKERERIKPYLSPFLKKMLRKKNKLC